MKNIKLFDTVRTLNNKGFICPKAHVRRGSIGTVVEICKKENKIGYIVEIEDEVYDFEESELEIVQIK